jgi:hypothetical protein
MILPPHNTPFCQDCSCEKIKNYATLGKDKIGRALALNLLKGIFERSKISFDRLRTSARVKLQKTITQR